MKSYWCLIKSHTEARDFDYEFEAKNDNEALEHIAKCLNNDFDKKFLAENTIELLENGKYRGLI